MQQGYPSVAVINPLSNSFERLGSTNVTGSSPSLYQSYPNPKKARIIHQTIGSKLALDSEINISSITSTNNNDNTSHKLPEMSTDLNEAYSSPCFYSSSLLEPYVVNSENIIPNTSVAAAAVQSQLDLQRIAAATNPNAPFSSIFLTGSNFDWDGQKSNSLGNMKQQFNNANCSVSGGYESLYGDITGVASNMLQGLKVRSDTFPNGSNLDYVNSTVNQQQRYMDSGYLSYEQRGWYKLKDELRSVCPVGSSISSDVISSGYEYNYRDIKEKRKCDVCGDISAGFHCSAFVCEACKKFFIRSSKGDSYTKYSCTKSNNCEIVKDTRTHCQYCRYQKCVRLGMTLPGANVAQNHDMSLIPCRVCGANSSGFHFGAITCEGCKGFFRRTINERENQKYTCRNGGTCAINTATRNNCKSCRYKKCEAVGMSKGGSRIGRQPNAIKHMCAKEISQIRALAHFSGAPVTHLTNHNSAQPRIITQTTDTTPIGSYLPNQLSNVIISSMNIDFGLSNVSRCIQANSGFPQAPTPGEFYIRDSRGGSLMPPSSSSMPPSTSTPQPRTSEHLYLSSAHPATQMQPPPPLPDQSSHQSIHNNMNSSNLVLPDTTTDNPDHNYLNSHKLLHNFKKETSNSNTNTPSSSNYYSDSTQFPSYPPQHHHHQYTTPSHQNQSPPPSAVSGSTYQHSTTIMSLSNTTTPTRSVADTKFSPDMPLHKFINNVNNACLEMSSFSQITQEVKLDVNADETVVWEAMMRHFHAHAIQVIKFAKAVPGFRELCQNDMKILVQEGMYPIILVQLARDYDMASGQYNYFNFSLHNQAVILHKFTIFNKIANHVKMSGQLIKPLQLDDTIVSLISYIELVKGDSCSIINRSKVNEMYEYSIGALRLHMTETGCSQSKIEAVHTILQNLSEMTHEHQEAVMTLRHSKPNLKFPNLYVEMFLTD